VSAQPEYAKSALDVVYLDDVIVVADWSKNNAADPYLKELLKTLRNKTERTPVLLVTTSIDRGRTDSYRWRYIVGSKVVDYVWHRSLRIL
jgi:hypothetical protein